MASSNINTRGTNAVAVSVDKGRAYTNNGGYKDPKPTHYASTNGFSRRILRRRPKRTGRISKNVFGYQ